MLIILEVVGSIFRVFYANDHVIVDNNNLMSFFPISIPLISFSCLIALAISRPRLNLSGDSAYLYLVPDNTGKVFSISLLNMMLAVDWS